MKSAGKPRVADEIVEQLRSLILRGAYTVGEKLPPERRLAEELGVNRASLREAIKSLEQLGLVRTRQGDGTRVLDFMQTAGVELVSYLMAGGGQPDFELLADVLEFRRWFGRECARLAALRSNRLDLERLEAVVESAADPELAVDELLKLDFEFYALLTQAGKNRVLQLLINTIRSAVDSYAPFFAQFNPPPAAVREHHRELLKAVAAHQPDRAAELADGYLAKGIEQLQRARG